MKAAALLLLLAMNAAPAPRAATFLPPVDRCSADPSFRAYKSRLDRAVATRDKAALAALISPDIMVDFGGGQGRAAFEEAWKLDRPQTSPLWAELREVLSLGCARDGSTFVAPSLFVQLGEDEEGVERVVVTGRHAVARKQPDLGSPVVAPLAFGNVLTVRNRLPDGAWALVRLPDGRQAYVADTAVRSPYDYRALFEKRKGRWQMTAFVGGD